MGVAEEGGQLEGLAPTAIFGEGSVVSVANIGIGILLKLPLDRRLRATKFAGNQAMRSLDFMKPGDRKPLLQRKMTIT